MAPKDIRKLGSGSCASPPMLQKCPGKARRYLLLCDAGRTHCQRHAGSLVLGDFSSDLKMITQRLSSSFLLYTCCVLESYFLALKAVSMAVGGTVGFGGGLYPGKSACCSCSSCGVYYASYQLSTYRLAHWRSYFNSIFCLLFGIGSRGNHSGIVVAAVIWAHRENINRLNAGGES